MTKRSKNPDNSKRPQPLVQQRAQARQTTPVAPAKTEKSEQQQQPKQGKDDSGEQKR